MKTLNTLFSLGLLIILSSCLIQCNDDENDIQNEIVIEPGPTAETVLQEALIDIEEGWTIRLLEGTYDFTRTLSMEGKTGIIIQGAGREKTILNFSGQAAGGDAFLITNSSNIMVQDLTISDAQGDALKCSECEEVTFYQLGTVWSGEPSEENGAYGLYPVLSSNILIDSCYAFGASDAGIYVGQSDKAVVRNSKAEGNVAGIEIENTTNADVYNNEVIDNTGGILVFDLPGLSQAGARTRIFDNVVRNNSRLNFAPAGNIVAEVPAGTGILVLSTKEVEIFDNILENNNVIGIGVFSYMSLVAMGQAPEPPASYDAIPADIYIHDNTISRSSTLPDMAEQPLFGQVIQGGFPEGNIPDLAIDGFLSPAGPGICYQANSSESFWDMNVPQGMNPPRFDISPYRCEGATLPAVNITSPTPK